MRILLVEDDDNTAQLLVRVLADRHYLVDRAEDGEMGWDFAETFEYDLILLDVVLPKLNGIDFCQKRRKIGDRTPILLLTAQDNSTEKVEGLDAGADDYLVKPFNCEELLARVRALLRRGNDALPPAIEWGALRLDPSGCTVTYSGKLLKLTAKEYQLLELFLRNPHRVFSQSALLDRLWSFDEPPSETAVRTQIKGLRQKLKRVGASASLIETIYGLGYRLNGKGEPSAESQPQAPAGDKNYLQTIWQQNKSKYLDRVAVIDRAIANPQDVKIQDALREAHTLVGALGIFGLHNASQQARAVEQMLKGKDNWTTQQENLLFQHLALLRKEIEWGEQNVQPHSPMSQSAIANKRLLIVDDDAALVRVLTAAAIAQRMEVETASDLAQARDILQHQHLDIVLLDLGFPDSTESGLALLTELVRSHPHLPTLVFTAKESFAIRVKVARLGGRGFLHKTISPSEVMDAIARVLHCTEPPLAKVLIVDRDPQLLDRLRTLLEPWGLRVILLDDPQQFWQVLKSTHPDLLILDVEMPEFDSIDLCQVVRNDPQWQDLPILILSAHRDSKTVQRVFFAGADDYIPKPIVEPELIARVFNRLERSQLRRTMVAERLTARRERALSQVRKD
ncbi:response regulator [Lusitaniella coriacea]|uniref:response regulator n=1 Tax=Lusitaniella coriacea TaxID=1983105 RepID=UPI003CEC4871